MIGSGVTVLHSFQESVQQVPCQLWECGAPELPLGVAAGDVVEVGGAHEQSSGQG